MLLLLNLPLRGLFQEVDANVPVRDAAEVLFADWFDVLLYSFLWIGFALLENCVEFSAVSFTPASLLFFVDNVAIFVLIKL